MSDDDLEKKMEFIVEQQANFSARMGQLEELVARFAKATADRFQLTDKSIEEHDERMSALVNAHIQTEESQKKTEESLRNLIAVVDRYFSAGRNGQSEA
jgi:ATP-dependent protease HslVU (ClpYQ) peptidase subunit